MAGVLAKARAAKVDAVGPDGEEQLTRTAHAEAWAWGLVNDLLLLPEPDGRDTTLLADLHRFGALHDQPGAAKRRGPTAYMRAVKATARESLDLADRIPATPARTAAGRHAKAMVALRYSDPDPDAPSGGFQGMGVLAASTLFDIVQAVEDL